MNCDDKTLSFLNISKRRSKKPSPDMTLFDHIVELLEDELGAHRVWPNHEAKEIRIRSTSSNGVHVLRFDRIV